MCPLRYICLMIVSGLALARAQIQKYNEVDEDFIVVEPLHPKPIFEYDFADVQIQLNNTEDINDGTVQVRVQLRDDWLTRAVLLNTSLNLTADDPAQNFTVQGLFLGYAHADISYCTAEYCGDDDFKPLNQTVQFIVIRRQRVVDTVFTILIICLVVTANLGMGCTIDVDVVKEVLKRPVAPLIGFMCQFCIMPPVSFMLGKVFNLSVSEQLGLLAVGSSPGGGASNMWTLLLNGDVSLSITMTLISTLASLGMFPLWIFTLGRLITDEADFNIPFQNIIGSLVGILVPVCIGILLQRKHPNFAKKVARITKPMLFVFLLFIFTFGIWVNWYMFRLFHGLLVAASMCLPYLGYIGGGLVAFLCRQPRSRIIAICLETGIQNVGVAIFALRLSLPQPENDLSITASVCPSSFTSVPLIAGLISYTIYKRCTKRSPETAKTKTDMNNTCEEGEAMTNVALENGVHNGVI